MKLLDSIKKELLEIYHDRTLLAVLIIFPIFVMLFMGSSFGKVGISGVPIGFVGPQNSSFGNLLISSMNQTTAFNLQVYDNIDNGTNALKDGNIKALIVIPDNFDEQLQDGQGGQVNISVDNSDIAVEQSMLAVISSVISASSTNITKAYVNSAWQDLDTLNQSASSLSDSVQNGRVQLLSTQAQLVQIKQNISSLNLSALQGSLNTSSQTIGTLHNQILLQEDLVQNAANQNSIFLNQSQQFIANATTAVNDSINVVDNTQNNINNQMGNLTDTLNQINLAITSATYLQSSISNSSCSVAEPTVDAVIIALESMRNDTTQQIADANNETVQLSQLNGTLTGFEMVLSNYSDQISTASAENNPQATISALTGLDSSLSSMNASFNSAQVETTQLQTLLDQMNSSIDSMGSTIDVALNETDSVDSLIGQLQQTVQDQTSKNPEIIASPLSVNVTDQYTRNSFVDFIMPQVISVSLLFTCLLLASLSLVREETRKTMTRLLMIPGALFEVISAKIITIVLTSFLQVGIIITLGIFVFGVQPPVDFVMLIIGTTISAFVLATLGTLIGAYAKNESAAIQLCLVFGIPMLFLGNIIFSADLLPSYTQVIQDFLPLAHITNIYKIVMITGGNAFSDISALVIYFIVSLAILGFFMSRKRNQ